MIIPKSERLHIGIFGRTNVGKSSILNLIAGQDVSLISNVAGTTTDVVEKTLELLPIGPVVILDSAGIDDASELGEERKKRTNRIFARCDFAFLVIEPNKWTDYENNVINIFQEYKLPFAIIVNKIDTTEPTQQVLQKIIEVNVKALHVSSVNLSKRDGFLNELKFIITDKFDVTVNKQELFADILHAGDICIMITPIDSGTPKGRMILPQVQALREVLDLHATAFFVQPEEYLNVLKRINKKPALVVCDSQVVNFMVENTPNDIDCTTFSILYSRLKGDLLEDIKGAKIIDNITKTDKILIAEACSHHAQKDDIGTKKIPALLNKYLDFAPQIDYSHGHDYPDNLNEYKLIIHCGACMLTRTEKLNRINKAKKCAVPITNYGMAISFMNKYLDRVTSLFLKSK